MIRAVQTILIGCLGISFAWLHAEGTLLTPSAATPSEQLEELVHESKQFEDHGDFQSAIVATASALEKIGPAHFRRRELEHRLIDLHLRAGTLDLLTRNLSASTNTPSSALAAWRLLAEIHLLQGHHENRRHALRMAHQQAPADESLSRELAEMESVLGDHTAALKIVERSLERRPADTDWTFIAAEIMVRQGHLNECEQTLNALMQKHAQVESIRNRVVAFYESHRMTEPMRRLVLQDHPDGSPGKLIHTTASRWPQDMEILTTLADTMISTKNEHPTNPGSLTNLAEAMMRGGDTDRAMQLIESARESHPADPDALKILLILCAKSGDTKHAIEAVDAAVASDASLAATLDYQLFQLLGSTHQPGAKEQEKPDSLVSGLMNSMKPGGYHGAGIHQRESELQHRWETTRSGTDALRLAHWQFWRNEPEVAAATLRLARLELPKDISLLALQLEFAQKSADYQTALDLIDQLQSLQPELSNTWASHRAKILLEQEQFDDATAVFRQLAEIAPENPEMWMNLASAQQRAGNYYGALESWMTAFSLADQANKMQIQAPILAVIERLRLWDKGVEFLLAFAATQPDEADAIQATDEAIAFAIQHDKLPTLRENLFSDSLNFRSASALSLAKSELAKATGDHQEMLRWLALAATQTTDRSTVWKRLLDASLASGDDARALLAASSLVQESDSLEAWIQLATTQESIGSKPDAATTWTIIVNRFARDPEALKSAADFFDRTGKADQAIAARMNAAMLDGATPETMYQAIEWLMASGDRPAAIALCDRLLDRTTPIASGDIELPGAAESEPATERRSFTIAMQAMGGMNDPESIAALRKTADSWTGNAADTIRLKTIQTRGRLSQAGAEQKTWSAWINQSKSPVESVWAWYAMNRPVEAMNLLESHPEIHNTPESEQSFAWIAIQGDQFERLYDWINQSPDDRRRRSEFVFLALSRHLMKSIPDVNRLAVLFPLTPKTINERWQAAWLLAAHGNFQSAVDLATPALAITPARTVATGAQTLASWNLVLRDTPAAIHALTNMGERNGAALDQPFFDAWRMRWLLESDEGRDRMEAEAEQIDDPILLAGIRVMAAALRNDAPSIQNAADDLISTWARFTSGMESDDSLETTIRRSISAAMEWKLPVLAFELTRATNHADSSQAALHEVIANESREDLRILSLLSKLRCTPPAQVAYQLAEYGSSKIDAPTLASMYRQLEASGHHAACSILLDQMFDSHIGDTGILYEMAFALRRKGDHENEIKALQSFLVAMPEPKNFPTYADASLRLSELLIQAHRPMDAWSVIQRAQELAPSEPRFATAADTAMKDLGEYSARIPLWKNQTLHFPEAAAMWITALSDHGQQKEIDTLLHQWTSEGKSFSPPVLVSLIHAYAHEDPDRAIHWLKELANQNSWASVATAAKVLSKTPVQKSAREILNEGVIKSTDPQETLACIHALIRLTAGDLHESQADMLSLRAEKLVPANPTLREVAHQIDLQIGKENPHLDSWLTSRLESRMRAGNDPQLATIARIEKFLDEGDHSQASALAKSISDARSWPRPELTMLANQLAKSGQHDASAYIFEQLYHADPTQQFDAFAAATQLWRAGDRHRSRKLIQPFIGMRWLDPVLHKFLANYFYETSDHTQATQFFAEIVARDPGITNPDAWAALSKRYAENGHLDEAQRFLHAAYSNPAFTDVDALVYFITTPELAALDSLPIRQRLSNSTRIKLHLAIIRKFMAQNAPHAITPWLTSDLATTADGLRMLDELAQHTELETTLESYWAQTSRELPISRALKNAQANFHLALAERALAIQPDSDTTSSHFREAADIAPWRFDTAGTYAQLLIDQGKLSAARAVIEKLLSSAPTPEDRKRAHELVDRLHRSDDLINWPTGS